MTQRRKHARQRVDRDELIQDFLENYEEELGEQSDEELIGESRLEDLRQKQIEKLTEVYSEELDEMDNEDLFGASDLDQIRDDMVALPARLHGLTKSVAAARDDGRAKSWAR